MALTKKNNADDLRCAYPDCETPVTVDEDWCHGCFFYICEEHSVSLPSFGSHDVVEHWEEDEF